MDAAGTVNTAYAPSRPILCKLGVILLKHGWQRIWSMPNRDRTRDQRERQSVSRKAARLCGRTASQLKAIVVDRFFETKREADAWSNAHSEFMTLRVVPPGFQLRTDCAVVDYKESAFERLCPEVIGSVEDYLCVVRYDRKRNAPAVTR